MQLWSDFLTNEKRVIHKWTHYFPVYERHLARFQGRSVTMLEIGCGEGGSLQMWKRYLGPYAQIVGVDIEPRCREFEEEQIKVRIGDQGNLEFLQDLVGEFGAFDIVLDDGSHRMHHMAASFEFLYPKTQKSGVYIVEDLHTCYWEEYGGGLPRQESFIERCKTLVDEMHADHSRGAVHATEISKQTLSMHIYDSIVVFERGQQLKKHAPMIGRTAKR